MNGKKKRTRIGGKGRREGGGEERKGKGKRLVLEGQFRRHT